MKSKKYDGDKVRTLVQSIVRKHPDIEPECYEIMRQFVALMDKTIENAKVASAAVGREYPAKAN